MILRRPSYVTTRLPLILCLAVCPVAATTLSMASSAQAWVLRNRGDFQDATLAGVSLAADGSMRLSAKVTQLLDAAQPNLWCLARDPKGRLVAGGGNEGKVFRIDPATGKSELVFDADELEVHAVAFDSRGALYVGTSPRGAVYRIDDSGMRTLIFDPEETYIWALAFDERDHLYVATGQQGRVYRIDSVGPNATGKVILDGREDHMRVLARGPGGALFVGSEPSGILYRIPPNGPATVVYDSPMREVAALAVSGDQVYMATLAPAPRRAAGGGGGGGVTRIRVTADDTSGDNPPSGGGGEDEEQEQQPPPPPQRPQARPQPPDSYYGAIYKVSRDGYARKVWESRESLPLSLIPWGDHGVLVGTGNDGLVLQVDDTGDATEFVDIDAQQVGALLASGGDLFAAASNLGQVLKITPGAVDRGTVTSRALDSGYTSSWGAIAWTSEQPKGSTVAFRARTGNTEEPDGSWSDWSPEYTGPGRAIVERPKARYVQWQAILRPGRGGDIPVLRSVRINYLQDNLPPEVVSVDVMPAGVTLTGTGDRAPEPPDATGGQRRAPSQPRRSYDKGKRAVSWKVEDANNDTMRYQVLFKAEDETLWKKLAGDLEDEFYTWDATAMPDGVYRIKVLATDAPSNPAGSALEGSRVSMAFDVDNTPPVVSSPEARVQSRAAEISVTVTDAFGVVGDVAYSLDAKDWVPVLPEDRIADSTKETYRFTTPELEPGEHTVTVKAQDRSGNTAANKVVIRVER